MSTKMTEEYCFILIDDVAMNNLLSRYILKNSYPNSQIIEFTDPMLGLEYIEKNCNKTSDILHIILLDIYMPLVDGWDFLDIYDKLNEEIKTNCAIYVLSSSINNADSDKANANKNVTGYALKPLTETIITGIVHHVKKSRKYI
jgi:response regulator RpfG family c-di-GMP phosphodiesterase